MTKTLKLILSSAIALALAAGPATSALGGALNGRTYETNVPSSGVNNEGHRVRTHSGGRLVLRVSSNGRSVTVHFTSSSPFFYCNVQQRLRVQSTRPAPLSSNGSFKATIEQRFLPGPGPAAIVQVITGHFSGRAVHGAIRTKQPECGGIAGFSANAR
jgi:hypothetical protein